MLVKVNYVDDVEILCFNCGSNFEVDRIFINTFENHNCPYCNTNMELMLQKEVEVEVIVKL